MLEKWNRYGGPMYYLSKGLKEKGFTTLGKITAVMFAIFCIGGSFGGGNAAQSNQATIVLKELLGLESASAGAIIGIILAVLVGIIIIGGIKRIASVTEKIVPFMAALYLLACLYIIGSNFSFVDDAFGLIFLEAFNPQAIGVGGVIGVLLVGFKRAAFQMKLVLDLLLLRILLSKLNIPHQKGWLLCLNLSLILLLFVL